MCQHHHNTIAAKDLVAATITFEQAFGRKLTRRERFQLWCSFHPRVEMVLAVIAAGFIEWGLMALIGAFHK